MGADDKYIREALEAEARADQWESEWALAYTARWHRVWDWAFDVLEWDDPGDWPDTNPRVTRVRASIVREADNEEEAFKRAIPVELIEDWLQVRAPTSSESGRRRVVIRLFTWVIDREHEVAYDPEWLKIADDMSPIAARARALRWAESYANALAEETVSREIRMTQIEIIWWTQGEGAKDA